MRIIFILIFISNFTFSQEKKDSSFCSETFEITDKVPKNIRRFIKENRKKDELLWYNQNNRFIKTYNIHFFKSKNFFAINYFYYSSSYSQSRIIFFKIENIKNYSIVGDCCLQYENFNDKLKCNCEKSLTFLKE